MTLSSKERAALRTEAHHLAAAVHVGHRGLTRTVLQTLDDALRTHELVKILFAKTFVAKAKDTANEIAEMAGADVVQVIGRTVTLYRENPELKPNDVPPWRRGSR